MANQTVIREQIATQHFIHTPKPKSFFFKRGVDIALSLTSLIVISPFLLILAAVIKTQSKGPIIYKSYRVGQHQKVFVCYKFRTMHCDATEKLLNLLKENKTAKKEWEKFHKVKKDPRIYTFGKFLRKYSLDELPQLFNVIKGEISLVGPRPIAIEETSLALKILKENAHSFFSIKPGITGIWQTSGRSLVSFEERLKMDFSYIEKSSFWFDLKLLVRTVPIVLFSKGAY